MTWVSHQPTEGTMNEITDWRGSGQAGLPRHGGGREGRDRRTRAAAALRPAVISAEAAGGLRGDDGGVRERASLGPSGVAAGGRALPMSPQHAPPYVKSNKNDANDADGIGEAACRPTMRFAGEGCGSAVRVADASGAAAGGEAEDSAVQPDPRLPAGARDRVLEGGGRGAAPAAWRFSKTRKTRSRSMRGLLRELARNCGGWTTM